MTSYQRSPLQVIAITISVVILYTSCASSPKQKELEYAEKFCTGGAMVGYLSGAIKEIEVKRQKLESIKAKITEEEYRHLDQELRNYSVEWETLNQDTNLACKTYAICLYRKDDTDLCKNAYNDMKERQDSARTFFERVKRIDLAFSKSPIPLFQDTRDKNTTIEDIDINKDNSPYLVISHNSGQDGKVIAKNDGKKTIENVKFEVHYSEKEKQLRSEGKPLKDIQNEAVQHFPSLFTVNLVPGYNLEWSHFKFPEKVPATYLIIISTRDFIIEEFCRLMPSTDININLSSRFASACVVFDARNKKNVKVLRIFHDPDFPKKPDGKFVWPTANDFTPPVPEVDTFIE